MFIVLLTPIMVGLFAYLNKRGKEPSSPGKIGIGMVLSAIAFVLMIVASLGLSSVHSLEGGVSSTTVSPFWLMPTYFTLTIQAAVLGFIFSLFCINKTNLIRTRIVKRYLIYSLSL